MKCVNKSSKEFKELQKVTGMGSHALATRIGSWQEKNNSDLFPSYNELLGLAPGSFSLYEQNLKELENFGSDLEYSIYVNKTGDTSVEGFKQYQGDKANFKTREVFSLKDIADSKDFIVSNLKTDEEYQKISEEIRDEALKKSILNGKDFDNVTVADILESALSTGTETINPSAKDLYDKAKKVSENADIKVEFVDDAILQQRDAKAFWDSATNVIYTSKESLASMSSNEALRVFLHEFTHPRTAKAILEPTTPEDFELVNSVREFIDTFGEQSDSYGFTNEMEFVSELYSNPEFAEEVREMYEQDKKARPLIQRILDAIRRLFNMKKPDKLDKIMETIVFNVEVSEQRQLEGEYGIYDAKKDQRVAAYQSYMTSLSNLQNKVADAILRQKSIDLKSVTDPAMAEDIISKSDKMINDLFKSEHLERAKIVTSFTAELIGKAHGFSTRMDSNIKSLDLNKAVKDVFESGKALDDLLSIVDDVENIINDFKFKFTTSKGKIHPEASELGLEEVHKVYKEAEVAIAHVKQAKETLNTKLTNFVKEYASRAASNQALTSRVTFNYQQKYRKQYHNDPKLKEEYANVDEYISEMLKVNKKEIDQARRKYVEDAFNQSYIDMSTLGVMFTNPLNSTTKLAQMATDLVLNMKDQALSKFRPLNARLHKLHNAFAKNVSNSLNQRERFKNMLKEGHDGYMYLTGNKQQEVYDEYIKAREAVLERETSVYNAFEITENERANSNDYGTQLLFRAGGTVTATKGETINLRVDGKPSYSNANVVEVETTKTWADMSISEKDGLAQRLGFNGFVEMLDSKQYASKKSNGSRQNPALYEFIHNGGTLDILSYTKETIFNEELLFEQPEMIAYYDKYFLPEELDKDGNRTGKPRKLKPEYANKDYDKLSKEEKATLDEFKSISKTSDKIYNSKGRDALVKQIPYTDSVFYAYPSHNITNQELRAEGRIKQIAKEYKDSMVNTRNEDVDQGSYFNSKGELVFSDKPYYRNKIDKDLISYSMFDVYATETQQMINRQVRNESKMLMESLIHISGEKKYLRTHNGTVAKNMYKKFNKNLETEGHFSNEYKKLIGIFETHFHDISSHNESKFLGMQSTKVAGTINGLAAASALTFNAGSGVANVLNGLTQLKLDAFARKTFNLKNLIKAENEYRKDTINILKDTTNAHKTSKTNQLLHMYNVMGGLTLQQQEYLKTKFLNKFGSTTMLNVFNESGEHMMSSVLTMAILDSIKVMNQDHRYIDKDGNVVNSPDKAASLLDMHKIDETTGLLEIDEKVHYTSHTPEVSIHKGGRAHIARLIKKRSSDLFGDYDSALQGEIMKKWYGKMLMMFKRFLPPGLLHRFRGIETVMKHPDEISDDERIFNTGLRDFDEGYYVSFARMVRHTAPSYIQFVGMLLSGKSKMRQTQLQFIPGYYNSLSPSEQANIRKAAAELMTIYAVLPVLAMIAASLMGFDDDDHKGTELQYFTLYQIARLRSELAQFHNYNAMYKMMSNPVAGFRILQNGQNLIENLLWIPGWFDEDKYGDNELLKSIAKVTPGFARLYAHYANMYNSKLF